MSFANDDDMATPPASPPDRVRQETELSDASCGTIAQDLEASSTSSLPVMVDNPSRKRQATEDQPSSPNDAFLVVPKSESHALQSQDNRGLTNNTAQAAFASPTRAGVSTLSSGLASTYLDDETSVKRARVAQASSSDSSSSGIGGDWQQVVNGGCTNGRGGDNDSMTASNQSSEYDFSSEEEDDAETSISFSSRPFNMKLLRDSIENGGPTLERVRGKDVVLIIGKTGTGKSTLIQGIAGKKLHSTVHTTPWHDESVRKSVFEAEEALPGFEIGHAKTSMTKHINCYVRQQVDTTTQEKTEVVYLDSPGFEDTDGTEMDIATSVMMSQVAQQCKSLRFVILINYASLLEDRGGAMRSVLKLTRSFVQDFNVKKKSFMFLFTHTNEIKEIPDSIEGAKECLRKEIIRTADGTKDEDVLSVLDFMSKCLQKGFPFVDVFHPLKSDFSKLATFIENKLKPVTRPTLAGNCGLTISSRLKLEGELQNLLLIFRLLLNKDSKDIEQVKDIRKTFKYFEVYIDTEPVRKAVAESTALFDLHVANLHAVVNAEICRGTGPNHFSAANVGILKNTMSQLRALSNDDNCIEMTGILLKVETFQKELLLERGSSFEGLHQKLGKLHAWSEGFTEFSPLYSAAHRHISELIRDCNAGVTAFDANELGSPSHQQLSHHIRNLSVLKSICENSEHLSVYDLDVKTAAEQHDFAKVRMHSALQSWDTETAAAMKTAPFGEHIHAIAVRTATLEILQELLEKSLLCPCLSKTVLSVRSAMEDSVVERFTEICSGLKTRRQEFQSDYEQRLRIIRAASDLFDNRRNGRWKEMRAEYMLVVECFKSVLKTRSGELEEKSKSVREHGMRDGGREGQAFLSFVASQWFDGFLQPQQCFVENCVIKIRKNYLDRISEVKRDADSSFSDLFDDSRDSSKAVSALKSLLPELHQITEFASITQHDMQLSTLESVARSKLYKYVDTMDERTLLYLSEWTHALQNKGEEEKVYATTESLNRILHEIELLRTLDSECDLRLQTLQGNIHQVFRDFCGKVQGILTEGDYQTKADCLSSIEALGSFSHTGPRLPELEEMKDQVRTLVSADAQKIEEMIQETSEWDTIDQLLEGLEKARLLDHFTSNEATSRLSLLRKVREQKETEVDDLVDVLIREQNFTGIREFLAPLAASRDQMKKQKFERCRKMICSSLRDTVEDLHRLLSASVSDGTTRKIVRGLEILEPAQSELGKHISDELPLAREITNLKKRVNARLVSLVKLMTEAMLRSDYVQLGTNKWLATMFSKHTERHLKPAPRKKLNTAMVEYNKAIASVSEHMQMFFECSFKDGTPLIVALSSLKRAFESNDPVLEELSELYQASTKSLVQKLNEILRDIDEGVSETHCFDDAITTLDDLDRQLSRGLKDHIRPTDLQFDCTTLLAGWRRERQEQNRKMEFEGDDAESKIEDWAKNLDRLHASSWTGPAYRWMTGMTYGKLCKQLENKVATRFSQGKTALQTRDHNLVQECIFILDLISRKVGKKHIMVATTRLEDLKQRALNSFIGLCEQAQQVLVSESNRQFEGLFADYRSFVLYVPCIMTSESAKKSYGLTNQLIFETLGHEISQLEGMVASFDFALIKSKVEHVRAFGDFIADRCTLFHEEVKCCDHIDVGKWLEELRQLCFKHFSCGRNLRRIKQCAVLGVLPSASKSDISKAYKEKAKRWHPDKRPKGQGGDGSTGDDGAMFRKVKEAFDELLEKDFESGTSMPFDGLLEGIGDLLRTKVREYMSEQRYELVEKMLFQLGGLNVLDNLVEPRLKSQETSNEITELVKRNVEKVKVEVNSNWSERKYRALNDNITDLKLMEANFKAYPEIFPTSWNKGIVQSIESEIEKLGHQARGSLLNKAVAKLKFDDFRRDFIKMGFVLVELPLFKDFTKAIMCSVLEACLKSDWGYSHLFDFGLSLQRGDENDHEDENRVGQAIVAEFSHFQEVMTMVWNEETSQKPAEDTVQDIMGERRSHSATEPLEIDKKELLESFRVFDARYKSLLGEYIKPEADLNALVQKIVATAQNLKPLKCSSGWSQDVKRQLPHILAGVFTVFTVLKSGSSYNRIEAAAAAAGASEIGEKLLKKPHNIQVLTLLSMLGCGAPSRSTLESQLMQIRTGEGKSMILGAAAVVLGLLGFRVRCVCYSEYLSNRDYDLFKDVFTFFHLTEYIKYSKITALSEDTTAAKGNIRKLTESLLRGRIDTTAGESSNNGVERSQRSSRIGNDIEMVDVEQADGSDIDMIDAELARTDGNEIVRVNSKKKRKGKSLVPRAVELAEEILLVDEVDVFFGSEFYGQTYNQVAQLREPEVAEILKEIWAAYKRGGRRQRLTDVKAMPAYSRLVHKIPQHAFLLDNEISLMLDQVRRVNDEPYFLDSDRIGYKVMDTISFEATYGYRTIFAYLKEADKGNLKNKDAILSNVLTMPVSCGQFSYANISPTRILGVSGTLEAMGEYEKDVMAKYGIKTFMYVPSVYGESNFQFDKAGEGICIESNTSDFFHKITDEIQTATMRKRAVIVFFRDNSRMNEFTSSAFYRKLSRQKKLLTEDMSAADKEFVINKAATSGQITVCSAVFGRGTDFFCKDERVQKNGGVHVIQTFLSVERSEEIQIQGRTARQGKKGSYQMVLLESDLEKHFGLCERDKVARRDRYDWLCSARDKYRRQYCLEIETNLTGATEKDRATHKYFDALLAADHRNAHSSFKEIYLSMKKRPMPSTMDLDLAFVIDTTGSMAPFARATAATIKGLLEGSSSIVGKLKSQFPEMQFKLNVAVMGVRDIDDMSDQFRESTWRENSHFTQRIHDAIHFIDSVAESSSGGGDLAEDHLGAIHRCASWNNPGDWASRIKFMMLLTDAPAHGLVPPASAGVANADSYSFRHPLGLTASKVIDKLISKEIDLFMCSFNPAATSRTEKELSQLYLEHPDNTEEREITVIPMVSKQPHQRGVELMGGYGKHIIFILDESGSMSHNWAGVVVAYNQFLSRRRQNQNESDVVSVVQFSDSSRVTVQQISISLAPNQLDYVCGGTLFYPAAIHACQLARETPPSHVPVVVFMSDGMAPDASAAAGAFSMLNREIRHRLESDLELHVIAFGSGVDTAQLQQIAGASRNGKVHSSADTTELSNIFVEIASGQDVAGLLEAEIGKRISEAVTDKLSLEYLA